MRFQLHERGDARLMRQPAPTLVEKTTKHFDDPAWTYEPKWDAFRVLGMIRDGSVRLISRNGHSFTNLLWPISDALRGFPTSLLVDGEVALQNGAKRQVCVGSQRGGQRTGFLVSSAWRGVCAISF